MGSRGPRSAADLSAFRPNPSPNAGKSIDISALARQHGITRTREVERLLVRLERSGKAYQHNGRWLWT